MTGALANFSFSILRQIAMPDPLVVYYHMVSDRSVAHVDRLYRFRSVSQFRRDLDVLLKSFRPLSLQDHLLCAKEGRLPHPNNFILTFDDGLRECHEIVFPILSEKGVPATFFLCSAFVDNKDIAYDFKKALLAGRLKTFNLTPVEANRIRGLLEEAGLNGTDLESTLLQVDYRRRSVLDEIAMVLDYRFTSYLETARPYLTSHHVFDLLKSGHAIGAHSIDHPRYRDIALEEQRRQTYESVRFVKEQFGLNYGVFSFPHSDTCVSREFFRELFASGEVDLCFGNQGLLEDSVRGNIQRVSMEKTSMSAEGILAKNLARRCIKRLTGALVVTRN